MNSLPENSKVSIVTPSFNQGQYLEATIRSVLEQTYPHIEYLIADGASKDNSREIIERYKNKLAWWVSEPDKGQADALNKGFALATGDIFAWLNSDDLYFPETVSEAVQYMIAHPEVGMVYGDARLIDEKGQAIGQFASKQTGYRQMLDGSVHIPQATTFFRADLFRQVGGLDADIFYAFDYDLWVRLAKVSKIVYLPRQWASFRIHNQGKTVVNDDRCYPDMIRIHDREVGGGFSKIRARYLVRRLLYAWIPVSLKIWLRKALTFK